MGAGALGIPGPNCPNPWSTFGHRDGLSDVNLGCQIDLVRDQTAIFTPSFLHQQPFACYHAEVLQHLNPLQSHGSYSHDRATHMIVLKRLLLLEKVRVHTTLTAKESQQKEKEKPHQASLYQMTARSTSMESSFANDGRSEDALRKSNLGSDAWLDITCAGRRPVTSYTRAMNAHTDFGSLQSTTVSPQLQQHLKFAVATLEDQCAIHLFEVCMVVGYVIFLEKPS